MPDRHYFLSTRITDTDYRALRLAAETAGLSVSEWLRLVLFRRTSGEDSLPLSLLQEILATRITLLNLLFYLGPEGSMFGRERLQAIPRKAAESSQVQVQRLCPAPTQDSPGQASLAPPRLRGVKFRLNDSQHAAIQVDAEAKGLTSSEWFRQAITSALNTQTVLSILKQQVLGLRFILDESIAILTTDDGHLNRAVITDLTKRTEPAPVRRANTRPARRNESLQED
jgi:predicted HicB family RNase H-like nuclease